MGFRDDLWWPVAAVILSTLLPLLSMPRASAQPAVVAAPGASPTGNARRHKRGDRARKFRERAVQAAAAAAAAKMAGSPGGEKKPGKPEAGGEKPKAEAPGPKPVTRPEKPASPPDPAELRLKPDKDGKIQFQFHGQKWADVLTWLADWSGMSLDWQQLPGDYLNLTTSRKYTAREARDLINEHLLARGFTMLIQDNVLWVCEVKKLDAGMVPRVTPEQLAQRDPHEFVKVSFALDWLPAETAAKELEPMKSPNGKLSPLTATNRLEAMDTVTNLRQIYAVLTEEQSDKGQQHLVRKFLLKHTRATDVLEQLKTLLGIESKQSARPKSRQEMEQQMRMAQMRAQQQQQHKKKGGAPTKPKPEIHLVAIPRENSILANAPPDKMAIITQAIEAIDVGMDRGNRYSASVERMNIYRLTTVDPEALVKTLQEIGNLDFNTRLEVDQKNHAIIAYASLADHVTIRALIKKLDGSARQFYVIPLRRLEADYVAGTIQFMMGGKEEKPQQRRSRWGYGGRRGREAQPRQEDQFSVDADVENNRLLLRANEDELRQVEDLLEKLGEIPARKGNPSTVRVIDAPPDASVDQWLEKIRRTWKGPNRLELDLPRKPADEPRQSVPAPTTHSVPPKRDATTGMFDHHGPVARTGAGRVRIVPVAVVQTKEASSKQSRPEPAVPAKVADPDRKNTAPQPATTAPGRPDAAAKPKDQSRPPPIKISRAPDGRLIIACEDPRALDRLENLMLDFPPPRKEYEVFRLKYADATFTAMDLRDFFKEEKEKSGRSRPYWYYDFYYDRGSDTAKTPSRLSKRRPLKFIAHVETNSVLVQGATPAQLRTIRDLITNVFDRREPIDSKLLRTSKAFTLKYSKASVIAETIKEVYRDLLSANDKSLQGGQKGKAERVYNYNFGDNGGLPKKFKFKGAISIGVDEMSNTLLVSTSPQLMDEISGMIETLDEAARPTTTVQVLHVGRGVSGDQLQETLGKMLGETAAGGKRRARRTTKKQPSSSRSKRSTTRKNGKR